MNLGVAVARLKLLEKKKTDSALQARPEIAEYVNANKTDRARVRVESVIREDYLVEAMELVEMYADILHTRSGLLKAGGLHESLKKPVTTLIWAAPRLSQYCPELKNVSKLLGDILGKKFVKACEANETDEVCERVMAKLDPKPPRASLVERYLIEICRTADVDFSPDLALLHSDSIDTRPESDFIQFDPATASAPPVAHDRFYDNSPGLSPLQSYAPIGFENLAAPTSTLTNPEVQQPFSYAATPSQPAQAPQLHPTSNPTSSTSVVQAPYTAPDPSEMPVLPDLPAVPPRFVASTVNAPPPPESNSFDDLQRRFENLRKKV